MKTRKFADLIAKARADPERSRRIDEGVQRLLREIAHADSCGDERQTETEAAPPEPPASAPARWPTANSRVSQRDGTAARTLPAAPG
jgi:hypothetical protein